ncbi:MAG: HlyD family efflux transporter periplasmic adaptor subunit [Acetobacteraceae bacterium]|nr:HlyD family efflux transporter periplasmic adaptor subunit [Acetobacteraceae bacterium]
MMPPLRVSVAPPVRRRAALPGMAAAALTAGLAVAAAFSLRPAPLTALPASVTADLLVARAPIAGEIRGDAVDGMTLRPGQPLLLVENPRAERGRLIDARNEHDRARDELARLEEQGGALNTTIERLARSADQHRREAAAQIEAQSRETQQLRAAAEARAHRAAQEGARTAQLARAGFASAAMVEKAEADVASARREAQAFDMRLELLRRQAEAAGRGIYGAGGVVMVGYVQERLDDVGLRRIELQRALAVQRDALARAERRLAQEEEAFALVSRAGIEAPAGLVVWRLRARPGQTVLAHEAVAELLDCRSAHVLVAMPEGRVAEALRATDVRLRLAGEAQDRRGRVQAVVDGPAAASAAPPATGEGRRLLRIAMDPGASGEPCLVGRAATVTFGG